MKHALVIVLAVTVSLPAMAKEPYLLPERAPTIIYPDDPKLPPYVEGEGQPLADNKLEYNRDYPAPPVQPRLRKPPAEYYRPYNPPPRARAPEPYYYDRYENYRKPARSRGYEPYYYENEYESQRAYRKERRQEKFRNFINKAHIVLDILSKFAH